MLIFISLNNPMRMTLRTPNPFPINSWGQDAVRNQEMFAFQRDDTADMLNITNTHRGSGKTPIINHLRPSAAARRDNLTRNDKTARAPWPTGRVQPPNEFLPVDGKNASRFQSFLGFGVADNGVRSPTLQRRVTCGKAELGRRSRLCPQANQLPDRALSLCTCPASLTYTQELRKSSLHRCKDL